MPVPSSALASLPSRLNGWKSCASCVRRQVPSPVSVTLMRMRPGALSDAVHDDRSARPVVLDRVGQQVDQHLLHPRPVGLDEVGGRSNCGNVMPMPRFCACGSIIAWHSRMTSASDTRLERQRQLARLDQREIEDLVDQLQQVPARLEDLVDASLLRGRRARARRIPCSWAKPRIALSGVRSSWLMLERKSDFARLAFSAAAMASFSSSFDLLAHRIVGADQQVADDVAVVVAQRRDRHDRPESGCRPCRYRSARRCPRSRARP